MKYTKFLLLTVLFLSLDTFCMFRSPQILKTLSKANLNRSNRVKFLAQNSNLKRFFSTEKNYIQSFKELNSKPISLEPKVISIAELEKYKDIDPEKLHAFLDRYKEYFWKFSIKDLERILKAELELLEFLKEDENSVKHENFCRIRNYFIALENNQKINAQIFNNLSPELQKKVLEKFPNGYKNISRHEFAQVIEKLI